MTAMLAYADATYLMERDSRAESREERQTERARQRKRRALMTEHMMMIADGLTESLERDGQSFTCPRHTRYEDKRPTICPLCALVLCRALLQPVKESY